MARKSAPLPCPRCAATTTFEKNGPNYDAHLMLTFLTCLLWLPVLLGFVAADRMRPSRCAKCGVAGPASLPASEEAPPAGGAGA